MSKILLKYKDDWADEMDINGFLIVDKETYDKYMKLLKEWPNPYRPIEVYVGTNESVEFYNLRDFKDRVKKREISDEEAAFLTDIFGGNSFGFGNVIEYLFDKLASDYEDY